MSVNKVILVGNVGRDPEVRHLESGASVASFTLATSERYKDKNGETKELTEWHNIVAWRQLADLAGNYIRKGSQIYVEGRLRSRSWDGQDGNKHYITEILADSIQLLGRRDSSNAPVPADGAYNEAAAPAARPVAAAPAPAPKPVSTPIITAAQIAEGGEDDLPF